MEKVNRSWLEENQTSLGRLLVCQIQTKILKKINKHLFIKDLKSILYLKIILKNYRFRVTCFFLTKK